MKNFLNNPIKYWWQILIISILAVMLAAASRARPTDIDGPLYLGQTTSSDILPTTYVSQTATAPQLEPSPSSAQPQSATTPSFPTQPDFAPAATKPQEQPPTITEASFFPVFPLESSPDAPARFVPVASSHPLAGAHAPLTRALIIVHDFSRDAGRALAMMMSLAGNQNATTMILAPQFLLESDISRYAAQLPDKGRDFVRWVPSGWSKGADSIAAANQKGISTFTVMDLLLLLLGDREQYPNLTEIVVAGHGEGGDFAQRYAAVGQAPDILAAQGISVSFVAANLSSYLFLTASRPKENKPTAAASPKQETSSAPETKQTQESPSCPDFNRWPYGLDGLNEYARKIGGNAIKLRYPTRRINVLIGDQAARQDPAPDASCAALAQGADRLARAREYAAHIRSLFGDDLGNAQSFRSIPGTGYDAMRIWGSACGMISLFGDGQCGRKPAHATRDD